MQLVLRVHNQWHNLCTPKVGLATELVRTRSTDSNFSQGHTLKSQRTHASSCVHQMVRETRAMESNQMPPLLPVHSCRPCRGTSVALSNLPQKHLYRMREASSPGPMQQNVKGRPQGSDQCSQTRRRCHVSSLQSHRWTHERGLQPHCLHQTMYTSLLFQMLQGLDTLQRAMQRRFH